MKERRETLKRVTLENRILLLLYSRIGQEDLLTVDGILTQGGMAAEFRIRRNNITRAVSELTSNELVYSRTKHIKGKDRRRKAYFLTEKGIEETDKIIRDLNSRYIQVRGEDGKRLEWSLKKAKDELSKRFHRKIDTFELISNFISGRELDMNYITNEGEERKLPKAPRMEGFFGREKEISLVLSSLRRETRTISVIGMAGQGKTSLVSAIADRLENEVIWMDLNPWISTDIVLDEIESSIGRPGSVHSKADIYHRAKRISGHLASKNEVLILDDLHRCSREMMKGIRVLYDLCNSDGWTLFLISRKRPELYKMTEAAASDRILEIQLEGLSRENSRSLMEHLGVPESGWERIIRVTDGNPLAINLCSLSPDADPSEISVSFENYLEENVLKEISSEERKALEIISCFDIPVEKSDLVEDLSLSRESIDKLLARSLIRTYPDNSIDVHDSIKDGIRSLLSKKDLNEILKRIRDYHMKRLRDLDMVQYLLISRSLGQDDVVIRGLIEHGDHLIGKGFTTIAELALEMEGSDLSQEESVRFQVMRYDSATALGDDETALESLRKAGRTAEDIVRKSNDQASLGLITLVLNRFAERALKGGMHRDVIKRSKKGLKIARESGAKDQEARLISNIGCAYLDLGEPGMASGFFKDALDIFLDIEDRRGEIICRLNLGRASSMIMDLSGALKQYLECIRSARKEEMTRIMHQANFRVGRLYWFVGDMDEALDYYSKAALGYLKEGDIDYSLLILNELIDPAIDLDQIGRLEDTVGKMERAYKGRGWSYIKYRLGMEREDLHPDEVFFNVLSRSLDGKSLEERHLREIVSIIKEGRKRGSNDLRPVVLKKILLRPGQKVSKELRFLFQ